jgi:DNA-binding transcriptional LysR family regulator
LVLFAHDLHPHLHDHYTGIFARRGFRVSISSEKEKEGSRATVAEGIGFTIVPRPLADTPLDGVVHRPLVSPDARVNTSIVWHSGPPTENVSRLVTLAQQV